MSVLGNLLLLLSALIYIALLNLLYFKTPPRGGDAVVGHAWGIIIVNGVFIISIVLAAIVIAVKGGFHWVGSTSASRFVWVTVSLLCILVTTTLSGLSKDEGDVPAYLRSIAAIIPFVIPPLLIFCGFVLMNQWPVHQLMYQLPLFFITATGVAGCIAFALAYVMQQQAVLEARKQDEIHFQNSNHQRMLNEIDSCDVTKNMVFILVFTDANQSPDIRKKAVEKIKTHPHWQQELVNRLNNDWAPEAFNFLASNDVDDPSLFKEAVKNGILIQAKLFRESIRRSSHPSHFYPGLFLWETERVIRTAERFKDGSHNYIEEMKELRAALDEPSEFSKPEFTATLLLNEWIKKQQ